MLFFSESRRLANGGDSVDIRVGNTIVNGQSRVPRSENEHTNNFRGEKYRPLQDEESRGKGDIEAGNPKAGENVYDEIDERHMQPEPEKGNWPGKPNKGIGSREASEEQCDDINDGYLVPQSVKSHGRQETGKSIPEAIEDQFNDVDWKVNDGYLLKQSMKLKSHGKQDNGQRSAEAVKNRGNDVPATQL